MEVARGPLKRRRVKKGFITVKKFEFIGFQKISADNGELHLR